jgi:hypothetical protein
VFLPHILLVFRQLLPSDIDISLASSERQEETFELLSAVSPAALP